MGTTTDEGYVIQDPKFRAGCEIIIERSDNVKERIRYKYIGEVPKMMQDAYMQLVGDANAKVGVTNDWGDKEFGKGVSANVFVSVTCNQDNKTMLAAIDLAGQMARWAARDQLMKAEAEFQQYQQQRQAQIAQNMQGGNPAY